MKKAIIILSVIICAASISSCGGFYDTTNVLLATPWQLDSTVTFNKNTLEVVTRSDYDRGTEVLEFGRNGDWVYNSSTYRATESGLWDTDQVPEKGSSIQMAFLSYNPGCFIQEGHSGETYLMAITDDGSLMQITHYHIDADNITVYSFSPLLTEEPGTQQ